MATDWSLHELGIPSYGNHPPAAKMPHYGGQAGLADDTPSENIVVTVPSVVFVVAAARSTLDIRLNGTGLDSAASPVVIEANQARAFYLTPGTYKLQVSAY